MQGEYNRRVSLGNSASTCTWVLRNSYYLSGEFALCEIRYYHFSCKILLKTRVCKILLKTRVYVWFWYSLVEHVLTNSTAFVFIKHRFYELTVNKARHKSRPVMFNFTNFHYLFVSVFFFFFWVVGGHVSWLVILPVFHLPEFFRWKRKD